VVDMAEHRDDRRPDLELGWILARIKPIPEQRGATLCCCLFESGCLLSRGKAQLLRDNGSRLVVDLLIDVRHHAGVHQLFDHDDRADVHQLGELTH